MEPCPVFVLPTQHRKPILKKTSVTQFPICNDKDDLIEEPRQDCHWSQWPEPEVYDHRPHTSLGFARPNIEQFELDIPRPATPGVRHIDDKNWGQPMKYIPEIQGWINLNSEYERNIVDKMDGLQRSNTFHMGSQNKKDRLTAYMPPRPVSVNEQRNSLDASGYYRQSWFPYHETSENKDKELILEMAKRLYGRNPIPYIQGRLRDKRPLSRHSRQPSIPNPYIHEHSMFTSTMSRCSGHFVIHPDWVSEKVAANTAFSFRRIPSGFTYLSR